MSKQIVSTADVFKGGPSAKLAGRQVKQVAASAQKMEAMVVVAAVSCILAALETRNATACTDLCKALGDDGQGRSATVFRSNELRKWLNEQGPVTWSSSEKQFKMLTESSDRWIALTSEYSNDPKSFIQQRIDTPFHQAHKQAEYSPLDLPKLMIGLLKRAEKEAAGDHKDDPRNNFNGLSELRKLVSHYQPKDKGETVKSVTLN